MGVVIDQFRSYWQKRREEKTQREWQRVTPQRRLELISAIAERMSTGDVPRRNDLNTIKNKLFERKQAIAVSVSAYERRERITAKIERDLALLEGIGSLNDLLSVDPRRLRSSKAAMWYVENERKRELQQQDDDASLIEPTFCKRNDEGQTNAFS
ncbi:unnamed protein product [Toxocara canis]|uniref:Uncharacterized protein n=1 Tax=Toxocara canis TaxID=6265 RepID=A0A183UGP6_TOXCA|nr:unnamed protein product [Toxocara canis]